MSELPPLQQGGGGGVRRPPLASTLPQLPQSLASPATLRVPSDRFTLALTCSASSLLMASASWSCSSSSPLLWGQACSASTGAFAKEEEAEEAEGRDGGRMRAAWGKVKTFLPGAKPPQPVRGQKANNWVADETCSYDQV